MKPTILIVDDNTENLMVLGELLSQQYSVRSATSGQRALELARRMPRPGLILLDVMMPGMSGHEVLQRLQADEATRAIPVIFATAMSETEDEQHGLSLGAVDYITKPLRPAIVMARVKTHLELAAAREQLQRRNASLEAEVDRRELENRVIQDVSMRALARLAETRDQETGNHILRTQEYVRLLATLVQRHPRFQAELQPHTIELMVKSAPLHDIGKVGIPDRVLLKPGKLTDDEWALMKTHARLGGEAIARAVADIDAPVPYLRHASDIAMHHHERWDGTGYPDGLAGEAIPLSARLMALADVFDAMISRRVYKAPIDFERVAAAMAAQRGRQFDPDLLDAFIGHFDRFCDIARARPDEPADHCGATLPAPLTP
ncbi:MAG: two-component system response regulator [Aquincola tertiaricarbonis]|uniref:response regulator n=1 Tax=Aquincola tertiaricarbonis TaxID=391953 RepID=UPI000AA1CBFA|nr:HD domain-containing phosphohydrolase [Aquincola tertiaricarbonis]